MAFMLLGMVLTGGLLAYYASGYISDRKQSESIREIAYGKEDKDLSAKDSGNATETPDDILVPDFESLKEINSDTVGWIRACDGDIDGPVVQTTDNSFYLDHKFDKAAGSAGCFFADSKLPYGSGSPLTVVYGHNRKDGSMFHPLLNYKDEQYFLEHPTFTIYTEDGELTYWVFSAYFADNDYVYGKHFEDVVKNIDKVAEDDNEKELLLLYEEALERSLYKIRDTLPLNDIVILSTCEYSGDNNRMVVYGVRQ